MVLPCDAQAIPLSADAAAAATTPTFYCHMAATELIKWSAKVIGRIRKKLATSQASFAAGRGECLGMKANSTGLCESGAIQNRLVTHLSL